MMYLAVTKIYPVLVSFFFLANLVLSSLGQFVVTPHSHGPEIPAGAASAQEHRTFQTPHQHWAIINEYGSLVWYSVFTENFSEGPVVARVERQEFSGELASIVPGGWRTEKCGEGSSFSCYYSPQKFLLSLQPIDKQSEPISIESLNAGFIPSIDHIPIEV